MIGKPRGGWARIVLRYAAGALDRVLADMR